MKDLLTQIPKLIELTLDKVSQVDSPAERPEVAEARKKLIKNMRGVTQELATLSQKYAQDKPTNDTVPKEYWEKLRVHLASRPPPPPEAPEQLLFDFMEPK